METAPFSYIEVSRTDAVQRSQVSNSDGADASNSAKHDHDQSHIISVPDPTLPMTDRYME
jgi:hypothetical protein